MINKQNYRTASVGASVLNSLFIKGFITTKANLRYSLRTLSLINLKSFLFI